MAHEETRRGYCSLAIDVFLLNLEDADMDLLPYLPSSLSWKTPGRAPPVGTPSAGLK